MDHTIELAHNSNPPMGANKMPTVKKSGSTVFGVRIGLDSTQDSRQLPLLRPPGRYRKVAYWRTTTYCHAFSRCCRNAVSRIVFRIHGDNFLLYRRSWYSLAGLRLFTFFSSFVLSSLLTDPTVRDCDMMNCLQQKAHST